MDAVEPVSNFIDDQPGLVPFAILCAGGAGVAIVLHLVWALARAAIEPSRETVRLLALRLAEALRAGRQAASTLACARAEVPWRPALRIGRAVRSLSSDSPPTLAATLGEHRVLPRSLAPLALAAERLGPAVFEAWLRAIAREPRLRRSAGRRAAPTIATIVALIGLLVFIGTFILPKLLAIFGDLGVRYEPLVSAMRVVDHLWGFVFAVIVAMGAVMAAWARWRWRSDRRLLRGEIIVRSVEAGVPEGEIAAALSLPSSASLPEICRGAGWSAADADQLALAIDRHRERRDRLLALSLTVLEMILPLLLAIPVLLFVRIVFGALIAMTMALAESL